MFGKAAPKKCLPNATKRYRNITRTYRKSVSRETYGNFLIGNSGNSTTIFFTVCINIVAGMLYRYYYHKMRQYNVMINKG